MKSIKEIQEMLASDLNESIDKIINNKEALNYYNNIMGNTSVVLVGLLELHLRDKTDDWEGEKWMDDCLISQAYLTDNKLAISGVVIWGVEDETEQWTEPFYFEIARGTEGVDIKEYTFLYGDLNNPEVSYDYFRENRNFWKYEDRDWKYIIDVKE